MKTNNLVLIIVPGHATFKASVTTLTDDINDDTLWALRDYQAGEAPSFIEHIMAGVMAARDSPQATLLFSGGRTNIDSGTWSEASTYATIATHQKYWQTDQNIIDSIANRVHLENYARDSFENLSCGLQKFHQLHGLYPETILVVGWKFKASRYALHARTLGLSAKQFTYLGVNNPPNFAEALAGELQTIELFKQDPWAERPPLSDKRLSRNPYNLDDPYIDCPTLAP